MGGLTAQERMNISIVCQFRDIMVVSLESVFLERFHSRGQDLCRFIGTK